MADVTTTEAPVEISENDQKRLDLQAKREYLAELRAARENLQAEAVEKVEAVAIEREDKNLDAEIQYEIDAARILLDADKPDEEQGEVEDGVYTGEAFVDETPLPEAPADQPTGEVNLPPEIELPSGYAPADLEPPTPAVESDTSLNVGVEVNNGPDTETE